MAARRLIIAMVIVLSVSTGIAIVAPGRNTGTDDSTTAASGTTSGAGSSGASGASGSSGTPGASGASGTSAASGTNTASGGSGATGAPGESGASGISGDAGSKRSPVDAKRQQSVKLASGSKIVTAHIQANDRVETVKVAPGDRLILSVVAKEPGDIQIEGLGLTATATEYDPAHFDILIRPGNAEYEVISVSSQDVIGRIAASSDSKSSPDKADAKSADQPKV